MQATLILGVGILMLQQFAVTPLLGVSVILAIILSLILCFLVLLLKK